MSRDKARGNIEVSDEIVERLMNDPFPRHLGVELLELKPGYARVGMKVAGYMTNIHGITHGGAVFTLADVALGNACNAWGDAEVAINTTIYYLRTSKPGEYLTATASAENVTRKTGLYRITVENESGEQVALAEGLVYRKSSSSPGK
ncbi:MAG: hotdog fold thioesterase [Firmicutes bacterium]|nr:hotdog fold thioesterase [Bacillota bacterium]MCL5057036.1 hotdog fold thioesterase [Actinomycetota bacterium]